jgi:general stress protein 26
MGRIPPENVAVGSFAILGVIIDMKQHSSDAHPTRAGNLVLPVAFGILILAGGFSGHGQPMSEVNRDSVLVAAREIIGSQKYCALITVDSSGAPQVRTMNPFPPDDSMFVWMATNSRSRKVQQIRKNPHVALFYGDLKEPIGYVSITGTAILVDDMQEKLKRKRKYWDEAFEDWRYLILIKIIPERLEVINYHRGMVNENMTWRTPSVRLKQPATSK